MFMNVLTVACFRGKRVNEYVCCISILRPPMPGHVNTHPSTSLTASQYCSCTPLDDRIRRRDCKHIRLIWEQLAVSDSPDNSWEQVGWMAAPPPCLPVTSASSAGSTCPHHHTLVDAAFSDDRCGPGGTIHLLSASCCEVRRRTGVLQ